jgi:hypothetical protein
LRPIAPPRGGGYIEEDDLDEKGKRAVDLKTREKAESFFYFLSLGFLSKGTK